MFHMGRFWQSFRQEKVLKILQRMFSGMGTREGAGILLMELHIILLLQEWHQNELNNILNVRDVVQQELYLMAPTSCCKDSGTMFLR